VVGVGLLLAGSLLGNDQSANSTAPQPAPTPSNRQDRTGPAKLAIGQAGITHDVLGNQTAQITASGPSYPEAQQFLEPGRGHWVVFDVDAKALRDNITSPQFYVLVDGEKFDADYLYPGNDHMLQFSDLQAGQRQSGTVGFDLPAEHGTLVVPGGTASRSSNGGSDSRTPTRQGAGGAVGLAPSYRSATRWRW
jgi:hypothetical protein